ncbi:hypothetical protein [Geothrix sp. 21YS21S-2]|uniref:hypothetical protein n=1 Tax=Geothrix sp. 21YS21S-2 TaxID=3068893 RepID=UPI0027BA3A04|nr:hypothetical protein [Geothrix sp. 21YS21S-2]
MIANISGTQTANNQATLTVTFSSPSTKPFGAYVDTIDVAMAYDKAGTQYKREVDREAECQSGRTEQGTAPSKVHGRFIANLCLVQTDARG